MSVWIDIDRFPMKGGIWNAAEELIHADILIPPSFINGKFSQILEHQKSDPDVSAIASTTKVRRPLAPLHTEPLAKSQSSVIPKHVLAIRLRVRKVESSS